MKIDGEFAYQFLHDRLLQIPVIKNCESIYIAEKEFQVKISYCDKVDDIIRVRFYDSLTPMVIKKLADELNCADMSIYTIIMAPYISEKSEQVCIKSGIGYVDLSGNIFYAIGSVFISEKGNRNMFSKKRECSNIFHASSIKTLFILRKLLEDVSRIWKLKSLSLETGCSLGLVFKVKEKLCEQLWAEMTPAGLKLIDARGLLDAWSEESGHEKSEMLSCYTLKSLPSFEKEIHELCSLHGIRCCLTGLAGGTRYAPVVRYNKVHILVEAADINKFIEKSSCKRVETGANVIIIKAQKEQLTGSRIINGCSVASPVQVFLDCMQIKGRGVEMADAVFQKEIRK